MAVSYWVEEFVISQGRSRGQRSFSPARSSVESPPTSTCLSGKIGTSPRRRPVCQTRRRDTDVTANQILYVILTIWTETTWSSLEDEIVHVCQCGTDTFQQKVEGLNGRDFLSRVLTAGAQRQTEVQLKLTQKHTVKMKGQTNKQT